MGVYYLGGGLLFIQCIYVCRRISLLRVHVICVGLYAALCTFSFFDDNVRQLSGV